MLTVGIMIVASAVFIYDLRQGADPWTGAGSWSFERFSAWPTAIAEGEWWRIVSSGFSHLGVVHIGFMIALLWIFGIGLERRLGTLTFGLVYLAGLVGGSLGAFLLEPTSAGVGASGAVFSLMGMLLVLQGLGGQSVLKSGLGPLIALNVLMSFRAEVSLGAHLGGLAVGLVIGAIVGLLHQRGRDTTDRIVPILLMLLGALSLFVAPAIERAIGLI